MFDPLRTPIQYAVVQVLPVGSISCPTLCTKQMAIASTTQTPPYPPSIAEHQNSVQKHNSPLVYFPSG